MRKCYSCNATKELKSIFLEDCDCHYDLPLSQIDKEINHSVCKPCFFEQASCGQDMHSVSECLEEKNCENYKQMLDYETNWNNYNHYWTLKKTDKEKGSEGTK